MEADDQEKRIWHYWVDPEGHLWHDGAEFEDPGLLKFFMKKMERLPDGRFLVMCQGETCYLEAADVPYVVQDVDIKEGLVDLIFQGGYRESLDPKTLRVGKDNVLYCKVRNGAFDARFNRKPYLELAHLVEEDSAAHRYVVNLGGKSYPIAGIQA